jgi:prophage tail gpP-like protein
MFEKVELRVAGRVLAHKACSLEASAEQAVRQARFEIAWSAPGIPCAPDEEAVITVSGTLWGTGYIRDVAGRHDERARDYTVSFVSRTADATEASVDHPTMLARDADLMTVAKTFDTAGIGVEGDVKTEVKRVHKVTPGETLYTTIESEARSQGVLIYDTPQGKLKLADKPEGRHAGGLVRGVNIVSASGQLSGARSFSDVTARGQTSDGTKASALRPQARARGASRRKRHLLVIEEGESTSARLKKRADWEARRAAGAGVSATVTTPGWRDGGGTLWDRNRLVFVDDDWLGIKQDMVIASVSFDQDATAGTLATLSLKDPRALGGENPRGKSAQSWAAPATSDPDYSEDDDV